VEIDKLRTSTVVLCSRGKALTCVRGQQVNECLVKHVVSLLEIMTAAGTCFLVKELYRASVVTGTKSNKSLK